MMSRNSNNSNHPTIVGAIQSNKQNSHNKSAALHVLSAASASSVSQPRFTAAATTTSLFAASQSGTNKPAMQEGVGQLSSPPSSLALLPKRNKYSADEAGSDGGDKWRRRQQPGSLSDGIGHGSSAVPLLGGGDRDLNHSPTAKALNQGWWSANIYENVVNESAEYQQQQLGFGGGGYGKLRKCEENIYENICEDCGRLYSAEKCAFCAVEDEEDAERVKKVSNKYSAKFQEFFGNFRIRPVRFGGAASVTGSVSIQGKRKLCKSDIVHNVNGFEDVFRTNKSFDLGEICRMRDDVRSQVSVDEGTTNPHTPDRALHKSDEQLTLEIARSTTSVSTAPVADTPEAATERKATVPRSAPLIVRRSVSENLIDFSESRKSETVYENLIPPALRSTIDRRRLVHGLVTPNDDYDGARSFDTFPVNNWMMSLLAEAEDYNDDTVAYHVKSIPSATFNDIGANYYGNVEEYAGNSDCNSRDIIYSVEEFRQNVINNKKRRTAEDEEYEKFDPVVISYCDADFESYIEGNKDDDRSDGTLTPCSSAPGDKSEFVAGLLNIFDAALNREKEDPRQNNAVDTNGHANDVIKPYRAQVNEPDSDCGSRLSHSKQLERSKPSGKHILVQKHLLAVSLCRVVITFERRLKAFLFVVTLGEAVRTRKLVLNRRRTYLSIMTNEVHNSTSALRESVEIDKYFQFLDNNRDMVNLMAINRRRRRRGEPIHPELQSNSSNEISCSSSTSGVLSDCGTSLDENIYQQIWTCKTEGTEPVYESPQENIYESIRIEPARDEHEWEVVDDFAFSKSSRRTLCQQPPPVPNRNIRHPLDRYRNVCILHSPAEPNINRIVYNYRRDYIFDYRKGDSESSSASSCIDDDEELDCCESCAESDDYEENDAIKEQEHNSGSRRISQSRGIPEKLSCYSIPDCVQYWKFMLLNVDYNDDEEDVIMTEKTLAVIGENIDKTVFPNIPQQTSQITNQKQPQSPSAVPSQRHIFSGSTAVNKTQIPVSDSCAGKYTKSVENLTDASVPQEKEKSPVLKQERMRDKLMKNLQLSSSRSAEDGPVFGVELSQVRQDNVHHVPRFVVECVEILKQPENIETSGLYRASGNKNSIESIKKKMNEKRSKKYEFLKKQDVHSLTGSLKLFFRELKSPLIPKDVYESCVQHTKDEVRTEVKTIEQIRSSIGKMETVNRKTLSYLIGHLQCVHQHSNVNMMNSSNLAIVWGACLFASTLGLMESYENNDLGKINTLVKQLIDHYDQIFYDKTE
ncbi:uncharacterized protein LOC134205564 isoform X2 [Armigeres subalbatus]|uniref:uncharacterized protein LOC134205564 isoform X2 n=1 Tax=Armigeres subalbatus TaxID=124917 RepID=UPI002ED44CE3